MKKFLLSVLVLVTIFILPVIVWFSIFHTDKYEVPLDRNILFLGDSHIKYSIDPSIFKRGINLSNSNDPLLGSYINLRTVLNSENNIDTVVLGFWQRTLSHTTSRLSEFAPGAFEHRMAYVQLEDVAFANEDIISMFMLRNTIISMLYPSKIPLGAFEWSDRSKLETSIARKENQIDSLKVQPLNYINKEGLQYESLLKIANLCESNGIALILMSPPIYKADRYFFHELFKQQMRDSLGEFVYIDHSYFDLSKDCYGDVGLLNYLGAERFSTHLQENGLFSTSNVIQPY